MKSRVIQVYFVRKRIKITMIAYGWIAGLTITLAITPVRLVTEFNLVTNVLQALLDEF